MKLSEFIHERFTTKGNKMILVGGRPAMGKSTFVVNVAKELAEQGRKILFFDLEGDARKRIEAKSISGITIVDELDEFDVNSIWNKCSEIPDIADYIVVVDYLQIVARNDGGVCEVQTSLKNMVDELGFTLIVTSQLSREIENRDDKRPKVSDLNKNNVYAQLYAESWFLYRSAYYEENANKNEIEVIVDDATYEFYWDGKEHIVE